MGGGKSTPKKNELIQTFGNYKVGMMNGGNWCYAITILQSLYYIDEFRQKIEDENPKNNWILDEIKTLFQKITKASDRLSSYVKISSFMQTLGQNNELFAGSNQQDSQEFLNYMLNCANDKLLEEKGVNSKIPSQRRKQSTWIEDMFGGEYMTEITCGSCKGVFKIKEPFFELIVDLWHKKSLTRCIRKMEKIEEMKDKDKYFCDICKSKQDALKRTIISKLPQFLILQMKRFIYNPKEQSMVKTGDFVPFPHIIKIPCDTKIVRYRLKSIIVHLGRSLNYGHYIALIKHKNVWFKYNDEKVDVYDEKNIYSIFGGIHEESTAYVLFLEKIGEEDRIKME